MRQYLYGKWTMDRSRLWLLPSSGNAQGRLKATDLYLDALVRSRGRATSISSSSSEQCHNRRFSKVDSYGFCEL
jgi:hypothetical protein